MERILKIGNAFHAALDGYEIHPSFRTAIQVMRNNPQLVKTIKSWDEMLWLCVEEFLNSMKGPLSRESQDKFEYACALLDKD